MHIVLFGRNLVDPWPSSVCLFNVGMQTKHCVGFLNVERAASAKPIKIDWPKNKFGQNLANQIAEISKTKLLVISAIINFVVILVSTPYFIRNDDVISTFLESKL